LSNIYGAKDKQRVIPTFIDSAFNNQPLRIFGKNKSLDLLYIYDLMLAFEKTLKYPLNTSVNIGSSTTISLDYLAKTIISLCNSKSEIVFLPERTSEVSHFIADISKAKSLLGWTPHTNLQDGLSNIISSYAYSK
jgi:nucleoside-diphosphate-sugar epimerase